MSMASGRGACPRVLICAVVLGLALGSASFAEEESAIAAHDSATLAKKLQNPVAALISVPFQSNFEWGLGQQSRG